MKLARTPRKKQQLQVDRLAKFKKKNAEKAKRALDKLAIVAERGENCFPMLLEAAEVCSLGQISERLQEVDQMPIEVVHSSPCPWAPRGFLLG